MAIATLAGVTITPAANAATAQVVYGAAANTPLPAGKSCAVLVARDHPGRPTSHIVARACGTNAASALKAAFAPDTETALMDLWSDNNHKGSGIAFYGSEGTL